MSQLTALSSVPSRTSTRQQSLQEEKYPEDADVGFEPQMRKKFATKTQRLKMQGKLRPPIRRILNLSRAHQDFCNNFNVDPFEFSSEEFESSRYANKPTNSAWSLNLSSRFKPLTSERSTQPVQGEAFVFRSVQSGPRDPRTGRVHPIKKDHKQVFSEGKALQRAGTNIKSEMEPNVSSSIPKQWSPTEVYLTESSYCKEHFGLNLSEFRSKLSTIKRSLRSSGRNVVPSILGRDLRAQLRNLHHVSDRWTSPTEFGPDLPVFSGGSGLVPPTVIEEDEPSQDLLEYNERRVYRVKMRDYAVPNLKLLGWWNDERFHDSAVQWHVKHFGIVFDDGEVGIRLPSSIVDELKSWWTFKGRSIENLVLSTAKCKRILSVAKLTGEEQFLANLYAPVIAFNEVWEPQQQASRLVYNHYLDSTYLPKQLNKFRASQENRRGKFILFGVVAGTLIILGSVIVLCRKGSKYGSVDVYKAGFKSACSSLANLFIEDSLLNKFVKGVVGSASNFHIPVKVVIPSYEPVKHL